MWLFNHLRCRNWSLRILALQKQDSNQLIPRPSCCCQETPLWFTPNRQTPLSIPWTDHELHIKWILSVFGIICTVGPTYFLNAAKCYISHFSHGLPNSSILSSLFSILNTSSPFSIFPSSADDDDYTNDTQLFVSSPLNPSQAHSVYFVTSSPRYRPGCQSITDIEFLITILRKTYLP